MTNSRSDSADNHSFNIGFIVRKYLLQPCLPQDKNPLEYWKSHADSEYKCISKIVPKYLCILASSAPVERIFSIAGKFFRPDRCHLGDKTFQQLTFIKSNNNYD